jgi:hypothetical protein
VLAVDVAAALLDWLWAVAVFSNDGKGTNQYRPSFGSKIFST